jgi:hypothetical protein
MKDAVTGETLRGAGNKLGSGDLRMRQLHELLGEYIVKEERTW